MKNPTRLLRLALFGNAAFSAVSGVILLCVATPLSHILGVNSPPALTVVGGLLLMFAIHLTVAARRSEPRTREVLYFCTMDALWIVGSAIVIAADLLPLTRLGFWTVILVALAVTDFLSTQILALVRIRRHTV